ncbi:MAG: response regulator [Phycisphaeraceae bacterium]|nr:MAG: response regulator [Phycisphaeraceae bacterium]
MTPDSKNQERPRLLVVGDVRVPAERLRHALELTFEVESVPSAGEKELARAHLLLASAEQFAAGLDSRPAPLSALLNAIGEGVCLCEADGEPLWANDLYKSFEPDLRSRFQALAATAASWLAERRRAGARDSSFAPEPWRGELDSGAPPRHFEIIVAAVDIGEPPDLADTLAVWPLSLTLVVRDVTAAHRLRGRMDAIDQAGSDLVQIDTEAVRNKNMIERLAMIEGKIVESARTLLHFDHFGVRILDDRTGRLELVIKHNLPPEYDAFDIRPGTEGHGISGWVAATGRSYLCRDVSADDLFLPGLTGARSSLTVPLKMHEKVIGVMNVESQEPAAFDDDDRRLAEIFARYIAMAVHTLDLLVVERTMTNRAIVGRFADEMKDPLQDICNEVDVLRGVAEGSQALLPHIDKIRADVEAIRRRMADVAEGPTNLLGVEKALADRRVDPRLKGKRVLVADDQSKIRRIIGDILKNRGCQVTLCENGSEAFERIESVARGESPPFDLVLSDIMMPDHNGYEVFAAARKIMPLVPVVLMTGFGYDPNHSIVRASQEGLQNVLFKPFPIEQLVDTIRRSIADDQGATPG